MQKTLSLLVAFFAVLLLRGEQKKPSVSTKEPFCFSNVFCRYFSKTKIKPAKKIKRNVFLSICSSFVTGYAASPSYNLYWNPSCHGMNA